MPKCKNDPKRHYSGTEPSPKGKGFCAHACKIGSRKRGRDGKMWVVRKTKTCRRWARTASKPARPAKRARPATKGHAAKKPRKSKTPRRLPANTTRTLRGGVNEPKSRRQTKQSKTRLRSRLGTESKKDESKKDIDSKNPESVQRRRVVRTSAIESKANDKLSELERKWELAARKVREHRDANTYSQQVWDNSATAFRAYKTENDRLNAMKKK